ncbi:ATP-binding protein, partial [Staphylococcus epidermidis]
IELYVKHLDLSQIVEKGNSIQHEARQRRYDWFGEIIQKIDADALLTAHHLDDQLETIFYRLLSGRSTRSALGMSLISNYKHY